jgi:serine/threonine-protein kinase
LDALKAVHDAGIWHLDLKPANILIDKEGQIKLIDFGASKQLNVQKGGATTSTAISYTNGYAPREQMEQNYDKFGPWTDIYALGATLYNLLSNKRPPLPSDIDDDDSADKHQSLPFPDGISDEMKKLVLQLMHTNRKNRPQSVSEVMPLLDQQPEKPKRDESIIIENVVKSLQSEYSFPLNKSSSSIILKSESILFIKNLLLPFTQENIYSLFSLK